MEKNKNEILDDTTATDNSTPVVYVEGGKAYVNKIDDSTRFGRHIIKQESKKDN